MSFGASILASTFWAIEETTSLIPLNRRTARQLALVTPWTSFNHFLSYQATR